MEFVCGHRKWNIKTVDIVQGLPKVEEILEARKIKNGCVLAPTEGKAYLKNTKIEIPLNFKIIEEKKYGISKILFICV